MTDIKKPARTRSKPASEKQDAPDGTAAGAAAAAPAAKASGKPAGETARPASRARTGSDEVLAVLPLRDIVVFPHMIVPLFVGREKSVRALEAVMKEDKQILLVAQKNAAQDDPSAQTTSIASAPCPRSCSCSSCRTAPSRCWSRAAGRPHPFRLPRDRKPLRGGQSTRCPIVPEERAPRSWRRSAAPWSGSSSSTSSSTRRSHQEVLVSLNQIEEPTKLADTIASHLNLKISEKQELLEITEASASGWSGCSPTWSPRSASCRWRSASATASSGRWRRRSASTT